MSIYSATQVNDLDRCLASITKQDLIPDQLVLVRDGPVHPKVEDCVNSFSKTLPLHHLHFSSNRGLGLALRDGLQACKHEFVARVDSDDRSVPERFALQVNHMTNNPSISVIGGWLREYYQTTSGPVGIIRQTPLQHASITKAARHRNPFNHPTVMFRRSHVLNSGNYEPCLFFEDYFLWAKMLMAGYRFENLSDILVETDVTSDYFSRRGGFAYMKHEFHLAQKLREINFFSFTNTYFFILCRLPLRLLPLKLRKYIYKTFLRHT